MNKIVKHYYDLSYEYHRVAATLWSNLNDAPRNYNPAISLLKLTMEFILKGLILKEQTQNIDIDYIGAAKIEVEGKKVRLSSVKSLTALWKYFKLLNKRERLCTYYTVEQEKFLDKVLRKCDTPDSDSTAIGYGNAQVRDKEKDTYTIRIGEKKLAAAKQCYEAVEVLMSFFGE